VTAPAYLLVANPTAQSGRNAPRVETAIRELRSAGLRADLLPTRPDGATVAAVREALDAGPVQCVIAMGGDGTFREVAQGLMESARRDEVRLGMLPAGTANNHGRSFGLDAGERALARNVAVVAAGRETRLDAGRLHATDAGGATVVRAMFFDSVGWGVGAAVIASRNEDRARLRGAGLLARVYRDDAVYAGALLRTLLGPRHTGVEVDASLVLDGRDHHAGPLAELLVRGTRVYAGGWIVDPTSRHDDGLFEVIPFPSRGDWLSRAAIGLYGRPLARTGLVTPAAPPGTTRAARIEVHFHAPAGALLPSGQMDGEELPTAPRVSIEVIPRAVRLIIP
jgi:diacylglycerol kinase family enzyme